MLQNPDLLSMYELEGYRPIETILDSEPATEGTVFNAIAKLPNEIAYKACLETRNNIARWQKSLRAATDRYYRLMLNVNAAEYSALSKSIATLSRTAKEQKKAMRTPGISKEAAAMAATDYQSTQERIDVIRARMKLLRDSLYITYQHQSLIANADVYLGEFKEELVKLYNKYIKLGNEFSDINNDNDGIRTISEVANDMLKLREDLRHVFMRPGSKFSLSRFVEKCDTTLDNIEVEVDDEHIDERKSAYPFRKFTEIRTVASGAHDNTATFIKKLKNYESIFKSAKSSKEYLTKGVGFIKNDILFISAFMEVYSVYIKYTMSIRASVISCELLDL